MPVCGAWEPPVACSGASCGVCAALQQQRGSSGRKRRQMVCSGIDCFCLFLLVKLYCPGKWGQRDPWWGLLHFSLSPWWPQGGALEHRERPLGTPGFLEKFLSLLALPGINTHFDVHVSNNTCVVKLGGVVFNPLQVQVMISALNVLVFTVKSPDWPRVDTLLLLGCCSLTQIVISPTQQRQNILSVPEM